MSFKGTAKKYVYRHTVQSKASADAQERGAERITRREGKREIEAQVTEARSVTTTDAWGRKVVVGGFGDVGGAGEEPMKWTRRRDEDGMSFYVSGEYRLLPCHNGFGYASKGLPRVIGWDIKFGDRPLRYNAEEAEDAGTWAYTVRRLVEAKQVAEKHAARRAAANEGGGAGGGEREGGTKGRGAARGQLTVAPTVGRRASIPRTA